MGWFGLVSAVLGGKQAKAPPSTESASVDTHSESFDKQLASSTEVSDPLVNEDRTDFDDPEEDILGSLSCPTGEDVDDATDDENFLSNTFSLFGHCVSAASTLGQRLKFNRILSTIDKINRSSSIGLTSISDEEEQGGIQLPRVIVIGDESAGKSSTLERIAMAGVLPRSRSICTRQPIVLKLRKDLRFSHVAPLLKLQIPGKDAVIGESADDVRNQIENHMKAIAETDSGIDITGEIEVEVRSNGVPNIDLVDLPGLVAVNAGPNNDLPELSEACTREYLKKESTGAVVCVIDAGRDNLRASNAIKLLQNAPEQVKNHAIGVFSKADKAMDTHWADIEDANGNRKSGPFWNLEERISGTAEDYLESEPFLGLRRGFVAVFNRDTVNWRKKAQTLEEHNQAELQWKEEHFSNSLEYIRGCIGLDTLILSMDKVICKFLSQEWVPEKLNELESRRQEIEVNIESLGVPPECLSLEQLHEAAESKMKENLPNETKNAIRDFLEAGIGEPERNDGSDCDRALKCRMFEKHVASVLEPAVVVSEVLLRLERVVISCFDNDNSGPIQLSRFDDLKDLYRGSLGVFRVEVEPLLEAMKNEAKLFFGSEGLEDDYYLKRDVLVKRLFKCTLRFFMEKVLDGSPIVAEARPGMLQMPTENCSQQRESHQKSLRQIDNIKALYESIQSIDDATP